MKHPAEQPCQVECSSCSRCAVLEPAHDKSIFLVFMGLNLTGCASSFAKKCCIDACPRLALVPDYAHLTLHAPVENGCVFSAARKFFRAVRQPEISGRAPRALACYGVPRH